MKDKLLEVIGLIYREKTFSFMWLLGHVALGYFIGRFVNHYTKESISIPLLFLFSLAPDIDVLFLRIIRHRGVTHSIVVATVLFIPIFLIFKAGLPYLAALLSHSLIGDYFVPPLKLFWPISNAWFGAPSQFQLMGMWETAAEVTLFALMIIMMVMSREVLKL